MLYCFKVKFSWVSKGEGGRVLYFNIEDLLEPLPQFLLFGYRTFALVTITAVICLYIFVKTWYIINVSLLWVILLIETIIGNFERHIVS